MDDLLVRSPYVTQTDEYVEARYTYQNVLVHDSPTGVVAVPTSRDIAIRTEKKVPKLGVMIVGLGGNNGSTLCAGILANRRKLEWQTKEGTQKSNWFGSLTQASSIRLGMDAATGAERYVPVKKLVAMTNPLDWSVGGWDISGMRLGDAMRRSKVLDWNLQEQVYEDLQAISPLPSIYIPDFIAGNQSTRANNVLKGPIVDQMEAVRKNIREFREQQAVDKVIVIWSANTERMCQVLTGVNDTAESLLASIAAGHEEISPSTLYCVASILEGCTFINGSPQNTFVPGVVQLAVRHGVFLGGDDFKSGQTKVKSVMVDFLVSAGVRPSSIVSYNHLGNNDGANLSQQEMFRSKEISKSSVVDDMVQSNTGLYPDGRNPDHVVVIKYVPFVGDSKRAMDEYVSEIFLGGRNTIVMHNTCEDSLLAVPLIVDLIVLAEFCERLSFRENGGPFERMHPVLGVLSYMCKAPKVPEGTPVVNALFRQRDCILNLLRATVGLPPDNNMLLEHKLASAGSMLSRSGLHIEGLSATKHAASDSCDISTRASAGSLAN